MKITNVCPLQSLDGAQRGEEPFADALQLVVIQRQEIEVLQVLKGVDSQTVNFVGVQQSEKQRRAISICYSSAFVLFI